MYTLKIKWSCATRLWLIRESSSKTLGPPCVPRLGLPPSCLRLDWILDGPMLKTAKQRLKFKKKKEGGAPESSCSPHRECLEKEQASGWKMIWRRPSTISVIDESFSLWHRFLFIGFFASRKQDRVKSILVYKKLKLLPPAVFDSMPASAHFHHKVVVQHKQATAALFDLFNCKTGAK